MKKILKNLLVPTKFFSLAFVSVICLALGLVGCTYHGVFINPPPVGAATALYAEDEESYAGMCRVHGFVHYEGYLYTVNRDSLPGRVYKIDASDLSQVGNYLALSSGALSDLIEEGGYLWTVDDDGILYKIDPSTLTEVDSWEVLAQTYNGCGALCSDGTYIYGTGYDGVFKFTISTGYSWENAIVANKALHAIVENGSYLYVNDSTTRYVYKVAKSDLEIDDTLTDPTQITDDMAEDGTYVYAGCEVQGPGLYRIRMSDLDYDFYEPTGIGECYGVFIVNERLLYLDYENSKIWVFTYPACSLLRELQFSGFSGSGELNELAFDDEYIYCTQWSYSPSYIAKFSRDDVFGYSDPTVLTDSTVTSVTPESFVAWGEITATGGDDCHERGICYLEGTSGTPNVDDDTTVYDSGDYGTGVFSKTISGLSEGTGYRIRAYAKNLAGISYGSTYTVYTSNLLGVDTDDATDITTISFTANGEITGIGESAVTTRGFYYSEGLVEFDYRNQFTITNAVVEYQTKILIGKTSDAVGEDVDCNGHVQDDFDDLRFTGSDGVTLLDYWIESIADSGGTKLATVWVLNDDTPSATGWMYYGNSEATSGSSGANTFEFFDDFPGSSLDTDKWDESGTGTAVVADSIVTVTSTANYGNKAIKTDTTWGYGYAIRAKAKLLELTGGTTDIGFNLLCTDEGGDYVLIYSYNRLPTPSPLTFLARDEGIGGGVVMDEYEGPDWRVFDIMRFSSSSVKAQVDGGSVKELTEDLPDESMSGGLEGRHLNNVVQCDWFLIRKYVDTEPTWAWGSEESARASVYEEGSFGEGVYDLEISGLDPSTSYKVMAFVENSEGYSYGDVVTCITACLLSISNIPDNKGWGILEVNTTDSTTIDYFTITNTGSCTMDIVIYGSSATGGDDTWTLDDTGTPGENIYALYAGLDDDDDLFDVIVRGTETYNTLVSGLAEEATQDWGLKIYMPTSLSGYDSQEMTGTITLVASAS